MIYMYLVKINEINRKVTKYVYFIYEIMYIDASRFKILLTRLFLTDATR